MATKSPEALGEGGPSLVKIHLEDFSALVILATVSYLFPFRTES